MLLSFVKASLKLTRLSSYVKDTKDSIDIKQLTHRREKIKVI